MLHVTIEQRYTTIAFLTILLFHCVFVMFCFSLNIRVYVGSWVWNFHFLTVLECRYPNVFFISRQRASSMKVARGGGGGIYCSLLIYTLYIVDVVCSVSFCILYMFVIILYIYFYTLYICENTLIFCKCPLNICDNTLNTSCVFYCRKSGPIIMVHLHFFDLRYHQYICCNE